MTPTIIPPIEKIEGRPLWTLDDHFYLAATIWAEARGEGTEGMRQVAHVIRNRVDAKNARSFGTGFRGVTTHPWQFSCWNKNDPNRAHLNREYLDTKLVGKDALRWAQAQAIALDVLYGEADITSGADHYHTTRVDPKWNSTVDKHGRTLLVEIATIGNHVFYKPR